MLAFDLLILPQHRCAVLHNSYLSFVIGASSCVKRWQTNDKVAMTVLAEKNLCGSKDLLVNGPVFIRHFF
jgi:hypothetical protein